MISERKKLLIKIIVEEYIKTAQPVSSGILVDKYKLEISPATVRNEMTELEAAGYIHQPHVSAGRLPTELAYNLYLSSQGEKFNKAKKKDNDIEALDRVFKLEEGTFRPTAKLLAELANGAIFWAFHKNDLYYTGLSNLFSQPEFRQAGIVCDVSSVIDRLEDIIDDIFEGLESGTQVLLGSKNPFGDFLSTVLLKYKYKKSSGLVGILGPMRMDYQRNIKLINYLEEKFN